MFTGRKLNRSTAVNVLSFLLLLLLGAFMALPFVYVINNAFKPLDELFIYPPRLFVQNPTLDNFSDMFTVMSESVITFSRYVFNSVFVTAVGTTGMVLITSLAAFVLAKYRFRLEKVLFNIVILSLMFSSQVTAIPNYLTMRDIGWIDSYLAIIVPAFAMPLNLFLMKQFMESMIPDTIIESASIDGAGILDTFFRIAMPMVKPAWLTAIIFSVQNLWNSTGGNFIFSEQFKPLQYALQQILAGGIVRTGVGSAVSVVMMIVPITIFILSQSKVVETMSASGLKE
ncbi:MAG TPA: carbohydrate ABC transporter permease [Clostridiales bacterium]|nr:carbohydrate ABC transporter permease [Clostridiales bacterium]